MKVSLYSSPCSFPFIFASHSWFVIDDEKGTNRYEKFHYKNLDPDFGYMSINRFHHFSGIERVHGYRSFGFWRSKCIGTVTGESAKKLAEIIHNSPHTYHSKHFYRFLGPNSNTYIQWILDQVPECGLKLPWNAFGKDFRF